MGKPKTIDVAVENQIVVQKSRPDIDQRVNLQVGMID